MDTLGSGIATGDSTAQVEAAESPPVGDEIKFISVRAEPAFKDRILAQARLDRRNLQGEVMALIEESLRRRERRKRSAA